MKIFLSVLVACLATASIQAQSVPQPEPEPPGPMVFDVNQRSHTFFGFGMGIHPSDVNHRKMLEALDLDFIRMEVGPFWAELETKLPTSSDDATMDAFVRNQFNADSPDRLDGAKWAFKVAKEMGAQVILVNFELPYHWLTDDEWRTLKDTHVDDLVRFWASMLVFLKDEGMYPEYVELANEPDGNWNGNIPARLYRSVVRLAREEFDRRGLSHVKILGPGLGFLHQGKEWVDALSADAVAGLHGWSTHVWDEVDYPKSRPEYVHGIWKPFLSAISKKDPERTKPLFVTEFATDVTNFYGKIYSSPRHDLAHPASDQREYGVRSVANALTFINRGANAVCYYRFSDQPADETSWGILRKPEVGGGVRPVYEALRCVFPLVPDEADVLTPTWHRHDDAVNAAAFYTDGKLVIAMANHTLERVRRILVVRGMPEVASAVGRAYVDGRIVAVEEPMDWTMDGSRQVEAVLPPETVLTLVLDGRESAGEPSGN